ncbi:MAG: GatB/YqeY domain-containing protein [Anaerolineales bacterium]|nr:GatB/YqeY domain-containing protein [Anaerolineales bacterium]
MALKQRLQEDLKDALRARAERRKAVIRLALAAIGHAEVERDSDLSDEDVAAVLQKQAVLRRDTIAELEQANRPDMLARELAELAILEAYLPKQLSRDEIAEEARRVVAEVGATGPRDVGQVMRALMARLKGRADGTVVNEIVREMLSG